MRTTCSFGLIVPILFLDWNVLGDELRELEVSPCKVDNLQRQVAELLDRLDRFKSLSEVKVELALQTQQYPY